MSDFYKRFLMEEGRRLNSETGRYVALAAFGKHPGWDDHIEDLGLETDSLILARNVLYVQGVGGQIDTGAWEKLKEEHRLPAFNHTFIWLRGDQFLLGRMWSSSDGKGRTRYPMIVCAHCVGASLDWALEKVLPRLMEVESACQATKTAGDVRAILGQARNVLRNIVRDPEADASRSLPSTAGREQFVSAAAFGPAKEGWFRILYWLQSQAGAFGAGRFSLKGDLSGLRAQQVRVPSAAATQTDAASLWARFFGSQVDRLVPQLYIWPAEENWLDVTLGEPSSHEFLCLRAGRGSVPLATEIPYDFDQKFRDDAAQRLSDFQAGRTQRLMTAPAEKQSSGTSQSATQRWLKSLGGKFFFIAVLLVAVAAAAVFILKAGRGAGNADAEPVKEKEVQGAPSGASAQAPPPKVQPEVSTKLREPPANPEKSQPAPPPTVAKTTESPRSNPSVNPSTSPTVKTQASETKPTTEMAATKPGTITQGSANVPATDEKPAANPIAQMDPKDKVVTNGAGMVMLWVSGLPGSRDGGWVGRCEVRQSEYQKVIGSNPSKFVDGEQPVENVSWREAMDFCQKLNTDERASGRLPASFVYALPTQQQWDFFLGSANFDSAITSRDRETLRAAPARVGTMQPNQFGLFDVLGNVWEWCADSDSSDQKVSKGGGYSNGKVFQFKPLERTTARRSTSDTRSGETGFRCVLVAQP